MNMIRLARFPVLFSLLITGAHSALAQQPGATASELSVESGSTNYSIPIAAPAGRGGMQPELSLNYSGGSKNGPLGVGWSIGGASSIHRCGATWSQDRYTGGIAFNNKDRFCLDGQRLIRVSNSDGNGVAEFRTEVDGYSQIKAYGGNYYNPNYFIVKTKAGQVMTFGGSNASLSISGKGTVKWALRILNDTTGKNAINYTYWFNGNRQYLSRIDYNGYRHEFIYGNRSDIRKQFLAGVQYTLQKRLTNIRLSYQGQRLKEYRLDYQTIGSASQSYLRTVHECDDANHHCYKPITFTWQQDSSPGFSTNNNYTPKFHIVSDDIGDLGSHFVDINGDGLVDQVYHRWRPNGGTQKGAYINTGSGWQSNSNYAPKFHLTADKEGDLGSRFIDVNGDGLVDQVFHRWRSSGNVQKGAYINTGSGWLRDDRFAPKYHIVVENTRTKLAGGDTGSQFIDVNGDGLVDQVYHRRLGANHVQTGAWINTGSGWRRDDRFAPKYHIMSDTDGDMGSRFVDVNGDGLVDQVYHRWIASGQVAKGAWINTGSGWRSDNNYAPRFHIVTHNIRNKAARSDAGSRFVDVNGDGLVDQLYHRQLGPNHIQKGAWINTGTGWKSDGNFTPKFHITADDKGDMGSRFIDINGDGLTDHVYSRWVNSSTLQRGAYINTGTGWKTDDRYKPRYHIVVEDKRNKKSRGDAGVRWVDVNGDGLVDELYHRWFSSSHQQKGAYINRSKLAQLTRIQDSVGNITDIRYKTLADKSIYKKHSNANRPVIDVHYSLPVVYEVKSDNGVGGKNTVRYRYEGLKYHTQGRGVLGFSKIIETYPETKKTKVTTINQNNFPLFGSPTRVTESYDGQLINDATTSYSAINSSGVDANTKVHRVRQVKSVEKSYELGDSSQYITQIVTENKNFDGFDNPRQVIVKTTGGGQTHTKTTNNMYYNNTTHWFLGRLTYSVTKHQSPGDSQRSRRVEFKYTGQGLLREEKIVSASNTSQWLKRTNYDYNANGQKTKTTISAPNQSSRIVTTTYDSQGRLHRTCNVYNECSTNAYNAKGLLATTTDPNSLVTRWTYDNFNRVTREDRPDNTWTTTRYYFASHSACGDAAEFAYHCTVTQTKGSTANIVQLDRLGREVRKISKGFDGRNIYSDTEHNAQGLVSRVSRDYYEGDYIYWATSTYDALDRIKKITEPGPHGSVTDVRTYYNGLRTNTYAGPQNRGRAKHINALGQVTRVDEPMGAYTEYTYYSDGNLKTTRVNGSNATTITVTYDEFGRKTQSVDPNMGTWRYQYNGFDEVTRQTSAKGQVTTMSYDRLGRLVARTEPEGTSRWEYGSRSDAKGSVGKLLQESGPGIRHDYSYDNLGRVEAKTTTIHGQGSFTVDMTYDGNGRLRRTVYPGSQGFITENIYNSRGYLSYVRGLRRQAQSHDYRSLTPLISKAVSAADEYQKRAQRLRNYGRYYQSKINHYRSLSGSGVVDSAARNQLNAHRGQLNTIVNQGNSLSPKFIGHLNHVIAELEAVNKLLSSQAQSYRDIADQLTTLAEQTLAAADHQFSYSRTYDLAADAYNQMDNTPTGTSGWINYWKALDVDASGRVRAEVYGNGIVNDYTFNQATGHLEAINSSLLAVDPIRHLEYEYDAYNNVTLRDDMVNDIRETFSYDRLDRLAKAEVRSDKYTHSEFNKNYHTRYDLFGNMTSKTGVGTYTYGQNGAGPNAVTNAGGKAYRYDANGNMTSGNGRSIQWSSFNKATRITQSGRSVTFKYGPDHSRFQKTNHQGDVTLYVGNLYEEVRRASGVNEKKHYIYAGNQLVAEHIVSSAEGTQTRYLHKDALSSVDLVTDAHANVVDRRSFDAWGKLRNMPWKEAEGINNPLYLTQLPFTNKGFTGHEHVQEVGLIHMNGRMYDATLGRFISADPHVQATNMSQSYNRYSYVLNNPLKYTDPSGYFFKKLFRGIKKVFKKIVNVVKKVVNAIKPYVGIIVGGLITTFCQVCGSAVLKAAIAGFASGAVGAAVNGGNILQSALLGGLSGAIFGGIGVSNLSPVARTLAHGLAGGTLSVLRGGKFGHGFLSAAFAKFTTLKLTAAGIYNMANRSFIAIMGRTTVAAIVGGTASVIGGGKFANGARSAAFAHLFNQETSAARNTGQCGWSCRNRDGRILSQSDLRNYRDPMVGWGRGPEGDHYDTYDLLVDGGRITYGTTMYVVYVGNRLVQAAASPFRYLSRETPVGVGMNASGALGARWGQFRTGIPAVDKAWITGSAAVGMVVLSGTTIHDMAAAGSYSSYQIYQEQMRNLGSGAIE